jgi:CRP-like cAMP-binding protein
MRMEKATQSHKNRLLELLDPADFELLKPHLHAVALDYRMPLYEENRTIEFVYFPNSGVASLVKTMINGSAAEVGTIGNEGMVGLPVIFGDTVAPTSVYIQVPGEGWRMTATLFRNALKRSSAIERVMLHYSHVLFNQVAQSAACNHFHNLEQRCCRWMLMTHDRVQSDKFLLTQEFLAMMLGVQRTGVNYAAGKLKRLKLIEYHRGQVTILDRKGLERMTCECYGVSKREYDRLLGRPSG